WPLPPKNPNEFQALVEKYLRFYDIIFKKDGSQSGSKSARASSRLQNAMTEGSGGNESKRPSFGSSAMATSTGQSMWKDREKSSALARSVMYSIGQAVWEMVDENGQSFVECKLDSVTGQHTWLHNQSTTTQFSITKMSAESF